MQQSSISSSFLCSIGLVLVALAPPQAAAFDASALGDLNSAPRNLALSATVELGSAALFNLDDGRHGWELWKTDLLTGETSLVIDLLPGSGSGSSGENRPLVKLGDLAYFVGDDGEECTIWQSNGHRGGTSKLASLSLAAPGDCDEISLAAVGQLLFFSSQTGFALWKSDGTADGTVGIFSTVEEVSSIVELNGVAIFKGSTYAHGIEPWRSDGTSAGTYLLADIIPGQAYGTGTWRFKAGPGGQMFFTPGLSSAGLALWRTDGTVAGTSLAATVNPGSSYWLIPQNGLYSSAVLGEYLYFAEGTELWRSNGTSTEKFAEFHHPPRGLHTWNNQLYFSASTGFLTTIWRTDGTVAGTEPLSSTQNGVSPTGIVGTTNKLVFRGEDSAYGIELWLSDGLVNGEMRLLKDLLPGSGSSHVRIAGVTSRGVLLVANDGAGENIWLTDGSEAGTVKVSQETLPSLDSAPSDFAALADGRILFSAATTSYERALFVTDGTVAGTTQLVPTSTVSDPEHLKTLGSSVIFSSNSELFVSDGSAGGTGLIKKINPSGHSYPEIHAVLGNKAIFSANDGTHGYELWVTDGTESGTSMLGDKSPGNAHTLVWPNLSAVSRNGRRYFFVANTGANGNELWSTDGTSAGTGIVRELRPGPAQGFSVNSGFVFPWGEDSVLFSGFSDEAGYELWKSDGTPEGTQLVKDLYAGPVSSYPFGASEFQGKIYFMASTGGMYDAALYKTDGTPAGTELVTILPPRATRPIFRASAGAGNDKYLYFVWASAAAGAELWRTDGTAAGTKPLPELSEGFGSGIDTINFPFLAARLDHCLFFAAQDGVRGLELVRIHSSEPEKVDLLDLNPGTLGTEPRALFVHDQRLFFSAISTLTGREPWLLTAPECAIAATPTPTPGPLDIPVAPKVKKKGQKIRVLLPEKSDVKYLVKVRRLGPGRARIERSKEVLAPKTTAQFKLSPGKWAVSYRILDPDTGTVSQPSAEVRVKIKAP